VPCFLFLQARLADAAQRNVPGEYETISAAIEAASPGDVVLVGPGVYPEALLLTEERGDGLVVESTNGPSETTIRYPETANENGAVVAFQRCSAATKIAGFTIDGRGVAKRGILASSQSRPMLVDLEIDGCEHGIASHRSSHPSLASVTVRHALVAGLFLQGGSADVESSTFASGEKFGIYIEGAGDSVRLGNCTITENHTVGLQASGGDFVFRGGLVSGNGDCGVILRDVSPRVENVVVAGHTNVGIVMQASSATIVGCTIRDNGFGAVVSLEGEPKIFGCTFEQNHSYHVGVEGGANPLIGGSPENANRFLGKGIAIQTSSTADVIATHNYWDDPCAPVAIFRISNGTLSWKPWMTSDLTQTIEDCSPPSGS
jgi:hypothetical protein